MSGKNWASEQMKLPHAPAWQTLNNNGPLCSFWDQHGLKTSKANSISSSALTSRLSLACMHKVRERLSWIPFTFSCHGETKYCLCKQLHCALISSVKYALASTLKLALNIWARNVPLGWRKIKFQCLWGATWTCFDFLLFVFASVLSIVKIPLQWYLSIFLVKKKKTLSHIIIIQSYQWSLVLKPFLLLSWKMTNYMSKRGSSNSCLKILWNITVKYSKVWKKPAAAVPSP